MKNPTVPCCLLVLALGLTGACGAWAQPFGSDMARQADAFLQQARTAASPSDAAGFVASALQLAPEYSEALYARARLEKKDNSTTLAAVADLQKAIASGSWTVTEASVAEQDLAEIFLRVGMLPAARTLLTALAAHDPSNPRTFLLLAQLYDRAGETAMLRRTLSDAALKFPLEDDFAVLASRLQERSGSRQDARRIIETQLKVHPDSLVLLLRAAELAPGGRARVLAADAYAAQGGKDPLAAVLALEAPAPDQPKYLSQFLENGGLSREDLVERVASVVLKNKGLSSSFQAALSRYSGTRDFDPQGDGFYQERWTFQDGQVTSWVRDAHEDGQAELSAQFQNGMPSFLTIRTSGDRLVTLSYSAYPYIDSVNVPASSESVADAYKPVPYSVQFPFLAAGNLPAPAGVAPRALRDPGQFPLTRVLRSSSAVEEYSSDGTLVRRTELLRGQKVFLEEATRGAGPFDHRVWYQDGQPVRGERDLDGSGRFAQKETWKDGRISALAVDTDGDGKVDYRETYSPTLQKSWDYDEDGKDDSREYAAGPGTVVREFSTGLNGVFDISFTWKNGALVGASKNGHAVAVTRDAVRNVVWIGSPARPGFDPSGPEGYRSIGGKEYLVFRHEGVTYVEEVP